MVAARGQLSRDVLVSRALELADTEGLDAVTIRRLAQEFGVTPMALYWHFKSKDELLAALGDAVLESVPPVPLDARPWDERLTQTMDGLVAALRAHPSIAQLAAGRILLYEAGMDLTERTLALLREAGFSVDEAANVAHHALLTALMLVTGEPGAEGHLSGADRDRAHATKNAAIRALPADRYPNVLASVDAFLECRDEEAYYTSGVDLFVGGVRHLCETDGAPSRSPVPAAAASSTRAQRVRH